MTIKVKERAPLAAARSCLRVTSARENSLRKRSYQHVAGCPRLGTPCRVSNRLAITLSMCCWPCVSTAHAVKICIGDSSALPGHILCRQPRANKKSASQPYLHFHQG
jgi:hypothetical protein